MRIVVRLRDLLKDDLTPQQMAGIPNNEKSIEIPSQSHREHREKGHYRFTHLGHTNVKENIWYCAEDEIVYVLKT